jgi:hypothetical protein
MRTLQNIKVIVGLLCVMALSGLVAEAISEPIHTETAWAADAFVDSIGVNTHLAYQGTSYSNYVGIVKPRLIESGIRHIRDAFPFAAQLEYQQAILDLGSSGIHTLLVCQPNTNLIVADFPKILLSLTNAVEMIEGPNESDSIPFVYKGFKFPAGARAFQNDLYAVIKAQPELKTLPVIMASMGNPDNAIRLGTLFSADYANTHCYTGGTMPGYRWNWFRDCALTNFVGPIMATECGYHNAVNQTDKLWIRGVSEKAAGNYITRMLAEHFLRGVQRTYLYELLDERPLPQYSEANFGLLRFNGSAKPAFTGVKNLISILSDSGPSFVPSTLDYSVNAEDIPVRHLLLQKRNGKFFLLLWLNTESFSLREKRDIQVEPRVTRLIFGKTIKRARTFVPIAGLSPVAEFISKDEMLVQVPDHLVVLEIEP